jgi:hypothetical protein
MCNPEREMKPTYPHHIGIRLTDAERASLQKLVTATGHHQSAVIRFLIRTAGQKPEAVAAGIRREQAQPHEAP